MYLSRTNDLASIALYLLLCSAWAVGSWLLVTHTFHLRHGERIISALATGFLLFISLSNILAHFTNLTLAFWVASLVILVAGILSAWKSSIRPWLHKKDLLALPKIASLAAVFILFILILKGESIFDEYLHIPLISTMAAGDIPPHFYLNPASYFAYHYGIQVFAASLVRMAGLFPWSAWDISRALAIAFTLLLGWLWVRRVTQSRAAAWLGTILFTFGGGARWLLLLLPAPWLNQVSQSVLLVGSGEDTASSLATALHQSWAFEGGGPVTYPFAFHNGIFVPAFFVLGSTGSLPFMTILLLLLLAPRDKFTPLGLVIFSLLFSNLALSAEHWFVFLCFGIVLAIGISLILQKRSRKDYSKDVLIQWLAVLTLSAAVALLQGGFITETVRTLLASISSQVAQSINAHGFSIRWPPGLLSAHLGVLSIFNGNQLITLLAELGPALLLIPLIFLRFKKQLIRLNWLSAGLAISVVISLVFPLIFQYDVDRSITRMPATALWTCLVLAFPMLWMVFSRKKIALRIAVAAIYGVTILAGLVIFWTQLHSIPNVEYTYYIDTLDAHYSADYWNKLPADAQVLDRVASRSVALFGRITRANSGIYEPLAEWERLIANPFPAAIANAGYDYVYIDRIWWDSLTLQQQLDFQQPCIDVMEEKKQTIPLDYRLLVNVSGCK